MIVDRILAAATRKAAQSATRLPKIGAYNCGKCPRMLWYVVNQYQPEARQARSQLIFTLGDKIEDTVLEWIAKTNVAHIRTSDWKDTTTVPELNVRVRSDFMFEVDLTPMPDAEVEPGAVVYIPSEELPPKPGELAVGEVKSMADYAFDRAQRGQLDDSYLAQVECYMRAYGTRHALVIAYKKSTSHLCEILIARSDERWRWVLDNVAKARGKQCPDRPHQLEAHCPGCGGTGLTAVRKQAHKACGGTGEVPGGPYIPTWPCGYCDYKAHCWGEIEMTLIDGKPKWRLAEERFVA